ncbi:MAG: hypothetical protein L3J25_03750 [Flavobacteriaceae bacterium]|nr:hypothetical protein [Flavobacteriaceae bacterium]
MKHLMYILIITLSVLSCKQEIKIGAKEKPLTIAQKIANANGYEHWNKVSKIDFTFNVDRDSSHFERSWQWEPKTNDVTLITKNNTISYNRSQIDSTNIKVDQGFINDKFWLLIPFQLVWDEGITISKPVVTKAPISKKQLNKITLTYSSKGGYTPGDAYDLFYDDSYIIREWVYRKGNSDEPSLINSFENYQDFNGLKIALEHKKLEGNWNLNFTNIKVTLE